MFALTILRNGAVMQRRRFKNVVTFPDDLSQEAERLRAEAGKLRPGNCGPARSVVTSKRRPGRPRPPRISRSG